MKSSIFLLFYVCICISCSSTKQIEDKEKIVKTEEKADPGYAKIESDRIIISNPAQKFDFVISDIGFDAWLLKNAKARGEDDQKFLESKNRIWVDEWNARKEAKFFGHEKAIDYLPNVNYGYEVNYMLYNYLVYWQETNNVKLD